MTQAVERIKDEIRTLAPTEIEALLRDIQHEYVMPPLTDEDVTATEAAWNAELDRRVHEIESGKVDLISAEESERRSEALFLRLNLQRPVYHP